MVSLLINSLSQWRRTNYTAARKGDKTRHPVRADSDEPDASKGLRSSRRKTLLKRSGE